MERKGGGGRWGLIHRSLALEVDTSPLGLGDRQR